MSDQAQPRLRRSRLVLLAFLLVLFSVAIDAFWIEPYWIEVTHHEVRAPLTPALKIAHLGDLHTFGIGRRERALLEILDREKPDLIVITGDTLADRGTYTAVAEMLRRLHAPLGVWLVRGNWENQRPVRSNEADFYRAAGVNFLLNSGSEIRPGIWLAGLDDITGTPNESAALAGAPAGAYKIVLFHSPAYYDRVAGRCDLVLAAHTHGGQIRPPLIRPFWLPRGSGRFLEGWYEVKGSRMYVSRGLGTSVIYARFNCRPEVAFITLGE